MAERRRLAAACGHYGYYYAQLDLLRKRAQEPSPQGVCQKGSQVEEIHDQGDGRCPAPGLRYRVP
ncbi:hypothetical protein MC885_001318 [Smutsia gigantea]|nr:hypothetical protein MC885_001318 [Smutsia gigantea]